jgi:hypothetical protein
VISVSCENMPYPWKRIARRGESLREDTVRVRSKIIRFIRDVVAILIEVRALIAELIFTAAAAYGCYIAYQVLTHRLP